MGQELFLEIGCEEIPARFIAGALEALKKTAAEALEGARLGHGEILTAGTPRRLALCIRSIDESQPELVQEVTGPARAVAFDADGNPTRAGEGFARSLGVDPSELKVVTLEKGEYVSAVKREEGRPAAEILAAELPRWITTLRFPKSMRWGSGDLRFARPVHWIVALLDGTVIDFDVEGIASGDRSRGHRFHSPGAFAVSGWEDYRRKAAEAMVLVDLDERREMIREQVTGAARAEGGEVVMDEELLDTVTNLVEYPVAVIGSFEEEFLNLPEEVLTTSMKAHQKYFTVRGGSGRLMARFIAVSNLKCDDMTTIRQGNERVLRARLSDAAFFYREDGKVPMEEFVAELKKVVYQEQLGSYHEKIERVAGIVRHMAGRSGAVDGKDASQAAMLSKADLVTQMVGEFPELQGVMGREYAILRGEKKDVAVAVYEHYLPRFAGDALPATDLGAHLSIADRIDSIAGIFGIGKAPTGSEDPYGLRRHTLAIINILRKKGYALDLTLLFEEAICHLQGKISASAPDLLHEIMEFFRGRLENLYTAAGTPADTVRSVLGAGFSHLPDVEKKIDALESFRKEEGFEELAVSFKRAANIVPEGFAGKVDAAIFEEDEEKDLYGAVAALEGSVKKMVSNGEYHKALKEIATIRPKVDSFFDKVLVMAKDEKVKNNRLALVKRLASLIAGIADFRQLAV
jgi:glycyl-tRNA synthetase beta chain